MLAFYQPRSVRSTFGVFLVGGKKTLGLFEYKKLPFRKNLVGGKKTLGLFEYKKFPFCKNLDGE